MHLGTDWYRVHVVDEQLNSGPVCIVQVNKLNDLILYCHEKTVFADKLEHPCLLEPNEVR